RFYSHQPDLNFKNPEVQKAVLGWIDFWFGMGVDGLRLDAVPYLYEREGTNCENLPETHQFLKKIRKYIDDNYPDRMLLAEANQWPEDAIAYFGDGDECNMAFHFPLMPRTFMSLKMEDRFPLIDIMQQTPAIPANCQWCIFLRNHDELTLEMVTDEERDYMYRVYAEDPQARINLGIRRRLAPLLSNNRKKIELMNALLFSFPGTPVIYYGDEIGMGDNFYLGDRNGVRTPMQWRPDRNAGFSQAHPQSLYLPLIIDPEYHYETINVFNQQNNPESLLWWMKHLLSLRKRYPAFSIGKLRFLFPDNPKVLAFITEYEDEKILILANLSRFSEHVELDLSEWNGMRLLELFGQTPFPEIKNIPYSISLNPYGFYWFLIEKTAPSRPSAERTEELTVTNEVNWENFFRKGNVYQLEKILSKYIVKQRWFAAKNKILKTVKVVEIIPFQLNDKKVFMVLVRVSYLKEEDNLYCLAVTFLPENLLETIRTQFPKAILAHMPQSNGYLIDAYFDSEFTCMLAKNIGENAKIKGENGILNAQRASEFKSLFQQKLIKECHPLKAEQSNTSININRKFVLKCYRQCSYGLNPDIEIGRYLANQQLFQQTPRYYGSLEYVSHEGEVISVGVLQQYIPHESDGWQYTIDNINRFFEKILAAPELAIKDYNIPEPDEYFNTAKQIPEKVKELIGEYGPLIHILGTRTAQMHAVLSLNTTDPAFTPEPFSTLYQRTLYQSIRGSYGRVINQFKKTVQRLDEANHALWQQIIETDRSFEEFLRKLLQNKISAKRIRTHGDYHLGQVLFTGKDFYIVDFEGEPARPLSERRIKRSALRDVAGMMRSFHYATQITLYGENSLVRKEDINSLKEWADFWYRWSCAYFLQGYMSVADHQSFLSSDIEDNSILLQAFLLEKAIYEIGYELNNRPEWVHIPCRGILEILGSSR
ncbi:MAG: putative maltokinase, partial [Proteobacteria bacterium]|nr:putative maltokinase [Pseudomonadota bacterium]